MGSGFRFKCNNCGGEYTVLLGVGFAFPSEYEKVNVRDWIFNDDSVD